ARNVGEIARSFASGASASDVFADSIARVSGSFRGSLLFAGAAAVGFGLYQAFTKASEAAAKLDTDIGNLRRASLGSGDFLGSDQINQNLDGTLAKIEEIRSRFIREHTGLAGEFNQALRGASELRTKPQLEAKDQEQANELRKAGLSVLEQM